MPRDAPPAAWRAAFLAAAVVVAVGTFGYAFATRAAEESVEAPLETDGARVEAGAADGGACLAVDVSALDRIEAALRLGCAANDPADGPLAGDPGVTPTARPTRDVTTPPSPRPTPTTPVSSPPAPAPAPPASLPAPSGPSGPADDPAPAPFLTPIAATPLHDGDDGIPSDVDASTQPGDLGDHRDADGMGDRGGAWWTLATARPTPGPWPEAAYDALAPFLSPPDAARPPPDGLAGAPAPTARCESVCDPRELGGSGAQRLSGDRAASAPARVGLLARALDAVDAYVRLRV